MTAIEPPAYDGFGYEALISSSHGDSELPVYTGRRAPPPQPVVREPQEFTHEIKARGGVPWATLTIQSDPRLTKAVPTITEGSNLDGSVKLALRSVETIQAVCVLIKGEIMDGGPASIPISFLDLKHTVWSAAEGDPLAPENTGKSMLKLKGDYHWPFSIELPTTLTKDGQTFRLPHTFMDRLASFSVRYTAELRILRGKLRPDDKVACPFVYFSMRQPDPPSMLRKLAYQENSPLFGPEADPEGWHTETFSVRGMIFSSRMIEVKCAFSLATPLSYTRSASIPCAMTIETQDTQALDLLSSPSAFIVYLERANHENLEPWKNTCEPVGQAVFWPSTEGAPEDSSRRRHLMGEIHLKPNLQPSSAVFGFAVEYSVVVFPFQAVAFKPTDNKPVFQQVVEITTRYAAGPRPRTYTPPTYATRNPIVDYYYYTKVMQAAQHVKGRGRGGR
ncbi:hypothetical protein B0H16DRAFT_1492632 [Mycena metata]|uniref:Arrestin-like N-terminal domain-containing protein n=1 Tax=Mycena metata TaxID=1033252 RepID=A0AAD7KH04_9AGAR|nr:hypothetical protein B0H16DRAFT_1492632 [Mycena metata]